MEARIADGQLSLERLALISADRSRMSPRRELDILALMSADPESDDAVDRPEVEAHRGEDEGLDDPCSFDESGSREREPLLL